MKIKFYYIVLIAILTIVNIFLFIHVLNFDSKHETLQKAVYKLLNEENPSHFQIKLEQYKEDGYIRQQERDTSLILTTFAIMAGFVTFITYRGFIIEVKRNSSNIEKIASEHETKYNNQHNIILELKSRIDLDASQKYSTYAYQNLEEDFYSEYVDNKLQSIKHLTDYLIYSNNKFPDKNLYSNEIVSSLKNLYNKIKDNSVSGASLYSTTMNIKEIRKWDDGEVDKYLDLISAKIIKDTENKKAL